MGSCRAPSTASRRRPTDISGSARLAACFVSMACGVSRGSRQRAWRCPRTGSARCSARATARSGSECGMASRAGRTASSSPIPRSPRGPSTISSRTMTEPCGSRPRIFREEGAWYARWPEAASDVSERTGVSAHTSAASVETRMAACGPWGSIACGASSRNRSWLSRSPGGPPVRCTPSPQPRMVPCWSRRARAS